MEASSSSASIINGGVIKFKNRKCYCGRKVAIKISESENNPSKLFFHCEHRNCKYYTFWDPNSEELNNVEDARHEERIRNVQSRLSLLEGLCARVEILESCFNDRIHRLEAIQRGLRKLMLVNVVLFGVVMSMVAVSVMRSDN